MKTAQALNIPNAAIANITRMTGSARGDRQAGRELYFAIKAMPSNQQAELLALSCAANEFKEAT